MILEFRKVNLTAAMRKEGAQSEPAQSRERAKWAAVVIRMRDVGSGSDETCWILGIV